MCTKKKDGRLTDLAEERKSELWDKPKPPPAALKAKMDVVIAWVKMARGGDLTESEIAAGASGSDGVDGSETIFEDLLGFRGANGIDGIDGLETVVNDLSLNADTNASDGSDDSGTTVEDRSVDINMGGNSKIDDLDSVFVNISIQ